MKDITGTSAGERGPLRDWIDPFRLYNLWIPAGRLVFLWGLVIYPLAVMFVLLTAAIIVFETAFPNGSTDNLGITIFLFMFAWVAAVVAITRRRLLQLGMSPGWVYVAILPIVNLPLFLYLLLKPGLAASAGEIRY